MNPDRSAKPDSRALLALVISASLFILGGCNRSTANPKPPQGSATAAALQLSAGEITRGRWVGSTREIAISGSVQALKQAQLRSRVDGDLVEIIEHEGTAVRAGEIVARMDTARFRAVLAQRQAQAVAAATDVGVAKRALEAQRRLVDEGFVAPITLDGFEAAFEAKRAAQLAAQGEVVLAESNLQDAWVRCPWDGIVFRVSAKRGEFVKQGGDLLYVVDPKQQEVVVTVSAADRPALRVGLPARLTVAGPDRVVKAAVSRISPMVEQGTRSFLVYLAIDDAPPDVMPGMFATGTIGLGTVSATVVPLSALREDAGGTYVLAVEQGKVTRRTVAVERRDAVSRQAWLSGQLPPDLDLIASNRPATPGQAVVLMGRSGL